MNYYWETLKLTIRYLNAYPRYWLLMGLRAFYITAEISAPLVLGHIINLLTDGPNNVERAIPWMIVFISIFIAGPVIEVYTGVMAWILASRSANLFRSDIVNTLRFVGLPFWQKYNRGQVLKVVDNAHSAVWEFGAGLSHRYLWYGGRIIGVFLISSFIDPVIALIYLVDLVFFAINVNIFIPKEKRWSLEANRGEEDLSTALTEYINNYRTITYLNLFNRQEQEYSMYTKALNEKRLKEQTAAGWKWFNNNVIHGLALVTVFIYGVYQVKNGNLGVGSLTTAFIFSQTIAENMGNFVSLLSDLVKHTNRVQRYIETFAGIKTIIATPLQKAMVFEKLQVKDLRVERGGRETLQKVNFKLNKGEKIAIVGYTGSGKSTLLDAILKINTDYRGKISLNGIDYNKLGVSELAQIFNIVPQEVQLFRDTLRGNILAGNPEFNGDMKNILNISGLSDLVKRLPNGLDEPINEGATNVSGGERQRIGIARSLVGGQPLLILDEATASLDPKTEKHVITEIIKNYPALSMIYVTHKYSLLNHFDEILVMSEGKVIEHGTFASLIAQGGLFKDLFTASQA